LLVVNCLFHSNRRAFGVGVTDSVLIQAAMQRWLC
jgi:hypothetical protein